MNEQLIERIDKYYGYARKIAGPLGEDLLHHIIEQVPQEVKNIDSYVYTCLENAFYNKNSSFNKLYRPKQTEKEIEYYSTGKYDSILLHTIMIQLENEGHTREIKVFREVYFVSNMTTVSRQMNIDIKTISKICKFVREEIQKRYELSD